MNLLEIRPYKVTVAHALQPGDLPSMINFSNLFLQSVNGGEVGPHLTFFLMKRGFIRTDMFPLKIISTGVLLTHY
jgi:hypothetical protein